MEVDLFPASDFDGWTNTYDQDVLETAFNLAQAQPGMHLLELGTDAVVFVTEKK